MTFTLSVTLAICLKLCPWMLKKSDEWLFQSVVEDEFHCARFFNLSIIAVLEGRTQTVIRNNFLRYHRAVRCRVRIITKDMFIPYYDLAKQLRFRISRLRLKQSGRLFHSQTLKSCWIVSILSNTWAVLWVVCVSKSWISFIENLMNTRLSSDTRSSSSRIVVNWVINVLISLLFVCTWLIKKF